MRQDVLLAVSLVCSCLTLRSNQPRLLKMNWNYFPVKSRQTYRYMLEITYFLQLLH